MTLRVTFLSLSGGEFESHYLLCTETIGSFRVSIASGGYSKAHMLDDTLIHLDAEDYVKKSGFANYSYNYKAIINANRNIYI